MIDDVKFIILSRSRTGSSLLMTLLDSHPDIICEGEIIKTAVVRNKGILSAAKESWAKGKISGFKVFYYHPKRSEKEIFWDLVKGDGVKVIHLKRKNRLRTIVSAKIAATAHKYFVYNKADRLPLEEKKICIDPMELRERIKITEKLERDFDNRFSENKIQVYYETLFDQLGEIQDFLGVEKKKLNTDMVRQNSEPLEKLIINYDEVKTAFVGTEYERYL